jgi:hypothetical protein
MTLIKQIPSSLDDTKELEVKKTYSISECARSIFYYSFENFLILGQSDTHPYRTKSHEVYQPEPHISNCKTGVKIEKR